MAHPFNELSSMAFITSATRIEIDRIMQQATITFPEPVVIQTAAHLNRDAHDSVTRDELERELSEPLSLLERLFPNEAALERKIAHLKWILAHTNLEEYHQ